MGNTGAYTVGQSRRWSVRVRQAEQVVFTLWGEAAVAIDQSGCVIERTNLPDDRSGLSENEPKQSSITKTHRPYREAAGAVWCLLENEAAYRPS